MPALLQHLSCSLSFRGATNLKPIDQFDLVKCLQIPRFEGLATIPVDANGGPIFQAPWQVQVFAAVIFLAEKGVLRLEEFQGRLNVEIESAIKHADNPETYLASNYYQLWLVTLETLLVRKGFCSQEELKTEQAEGLLV